MMEEKQTVSKIKRNVTSEICCFFIHGNPRSPTSSCFANGGAPSDAAHEVHEVREVHEVHGAKACLSC